MKNLSLSLLAASAMALFALPASAAVTTPSCYFVSGGTITPVTCTESAQKRGDHGDLTVPRKEKKDDPVETAK